MYRARRNDLPRRLFSEHSLLSCIPPWRSSLQKYLTFPIRETGEGNCEIPSAQIIFEVREKKKWDLPEASFLFEVCIQFSVVLSL